MTRVIPGKWWYSEFEPSTREAIRSMLKLAEVKPDEVVYDIGCGNGNILLEAQKQGAQVIGVDRYLSRVNKTQKRLDPSALIVYGDIFDDIFWEHKESEEPYVVRKADVLVLFHNEKMNNNLKPLLEKELNPGARVVSNYWPIDGWKISRQINRHDPDLMIYLYKVPESLNQIQTH